eukprot:2025999-Amphidinium_carterae.2
MTYRPLKRLFRDTIQGCKDVFAGRGRCLFPDPSFSVGGGCVSVSIELPKKETATGKNEPPFRSSVAQLELHFRVQ